MPNVKFLVASSVEVADELKCEKHEKPSLEPVSGLSVLDYCIIIASAPSVDIRGLLWCKANTTTLSFMWLYTNETMNIIFSLCQNILLSAKHRSPHPDDIKNNIPACLGPQCAFRTNRSTEDAISTALHSVFTRHEHINSTAHYAVC